nr:helix-turn-helix domain-containing protein [Mycolicibacterium fortuitum]
MSTPSPTRRPTGPAVVPAILDAAAELFAERGPARTSLRDVAARAGVTYGLVFRHFGTKESLVAAVLDRLANELVTLIENGTRTAAFEAAVNRHSLVVARTMLDGYPAEKLQTRFPGTEILIRELTDIWDDELDARLAAANAIALQISWRLFEPYLRVATGLDAISAEKVQAAVQRTLKRVTQPGRDRPVAG